MCLWPHETRPPGAKGLWSVALDHQHVIISPVQVTEPYKRKTNSLALKDFFFNLAKEPRQNIAYD